MVRLVQEMPYLIMPFISLENNVLAEMQDKIFILNLFEKIVLISCVVIMLFVVENNQKWFEIKTQQQKIFFFLAITALFAYYIGWIFYFRAKTLPNNGRFAARL
jgi:uncharacterized membrane protein